MGVRDNTGRGAIRWGDAVLAAIASVSWALVAMAGTAALGLHLLGADAAGALGPMTAAVVVLGAGGSVTPSGDVSAFGLSGAEASTTVDFAPLGVGLAGAVLLAWFFLRSLRAAGTWISGTELAVRAAAVAVLFVAVIGGLAWAGHDLITIDGGQLGLDKVKVPGIPGLGDIGGLLPGRLAGLAHAKARVGFSVDAARSLAGAVCWVLGVLVIALLASRRTPLPRGWEALHRVVRPAVSALVAVALVAVAAGLAAAAYAAIGDAHPRRIAGAALLGAPNAVWLAIPLGLFVPWSGHATGTLARLLPHPLDQLLGVRTDQSVTLGRLAQLDHRVWLLALATAVLMLYAGVLAAARTPVRGRSLGAFTGSCALALGAATALALPLMVWLTGVSANASLSVLGFDAFGAGVELHGDAGLAVALGAAWGAGAGAAGALLARVSGAAGRRAAPLAGEASAPPGPRGETAGAPGPYHPAPPYRPPNPDTNPYLKLPPGLHGSPTLPGLPDRPPAGPRPRRPPYEGPPPPPGAPRGRR
ncbi:streptophobe family protein [Streptomyces sp. NPDC050485]|uniref:streptophobe family protein n=1 Tax=Streptomyces sp. NPDC050485 TaxID=3365617 RepID=UPI0037B78967